MIFLKLFFCKLLGFHDNVFLYERTEGCEEGTVTSYFYRCKRCEEELVITFAEDR